MKTIFGSRGLLLGVLFTAALLNACQAGGGNGGNNGNANGSKDRDDPLGLSAGTDNGWNFNNAGSKDQARSRLASSSLASLAPSDFQAAAQDSNPGGAGGTKGGLKLRAMFNDWASTFGQTYNSPQERQAAFRNFVDNMADVQQINSDSNTPFWASGNAFSGLSFDQFASSYLMNSNVIGSPPSGSANGVFQPDQNRKLLQSSPASVNWVSSGKVPPIKNQGGCGSCWAFAATAAIESRYLINQGGSAATINLSEQQLVSCVNSANGYAGYGCNGGWSDQAINYVAGVNQTTESRYPYTTTTGSCDMTIVSSSGTGQAVKLSGNALQVQSQSQSALRAAVATAPAVIYFSVDRSFQSYAGGIYSSSTCSRTAVNHAMVATGYSTSGTPFWNIRNSWGTGWGEQGYARVKMTTTGVCNMYKYGAHMPPATFTQTLAA